MCFAAFILNAIVKSNYCIGSKLYFLSNFVKIRLQIYAIIGIVIVAIKTMAVMRNFITGPLNNNLRMKEGVIVSGLQATTITNGSYAEFRE